MTDTGVWNGCVFKTVVADPVNSKYDLIELTDIRRSC